MRSSPWMNLITPDIATAPSMARRVDEKNELVRPFMNSRFGSSKSGRRGPSSRHKNPSRSRSRPESEFAATTELAHQDEAPTPKPRVRPLRQQKALIVAGGTEGDVFPGLAVAQALQHQGWTVHWLGAPDSVEERLVLPHDIAFETISHSGLGAQNLFTLMVLPLLLLRSCWQARAVMRRVKPDVVIGLGGHVTLPAGIAAKLAGKNLVLHEKNAVPGLSTRMLGRMVKRVYTGFPNVLASGRWVGNPVRRAFDEQVKPERRLGKRDGPLRLLVVGGSLGSDVFDKLVPKALEWMHADQRPIVTHQSDELQIDALRRKYQAAKVEATLVPFIDDMATALAEADLVLCHAGASTVAEIAAVGAAAVFVPRANAVGDHEAANAQYLVKTGGGWLMPESELTVKSLAKLLEGIKRPELIRKAQKARTMKKSHAAREIIMACEKLVR